MNAKTTREGIIICARLDHSIQVMVPAQLALQANLALSPSVVIVQMEQNALMELMPQNIALTVNSASLAMIAVREAKRLQALNVSKANSVWAVN